LPTGLAADLHVIVLRLGRIKVESILLFVLLASGVLTATTAASKFEPRAFAADLSVHHLTFLSAC